jgi:hypothetical protein
MSCIDHCANSNHLRTEDDSGKVFEHPISPCLPLRTPLILDLRPFSGLVSFWVHNATHVYGWDTPPKSAIVPFHHYPGTFRFVADVTAERGKIVLSELAAFISVDVEVGHHRLQFDWGRDRVFQMTLNSFPFQSSRFPLAALMMTSLP